MAFESLILDARGNPYQGSVDAITGETLTDARAATAVLAAANAEVLVDIQGKAVVNFDVRSAAGVLTFVFEGTIDGTNYYALPAWAINQVVAGAATAEQFVGPVTIATTIASAYQVGCSGYRRIRCRVSAYTSGNIVVAARASLADNIINTRLLPSVLHISATAAANTAATATLPAPGVGLFHYITHIGITRNATALLAGTATLIHTTTNLPGSMAWSVGNAMAAGGTQVDVVYEPTTPLKSLVANTATTVVAAAAGLAVLGRVNVSYYVGS
jgi:hypothetical protein